MLEVRRSNDNENLVRRGRGDRIRPHHRSRSADVAGRCQAHHPDRLYAARLAEPNGHRRDIGRFRNCDEIPAHEYFDEIYGHHGQKRTEHSSGE